MRYPRRVGLAAGAIVLGTSLLPSALDAQLMDQTQVRPTNDLPNPYVRVHPWGELHTGPYDAGAYDARSSFMGAAEGPDGNLYFMSRCIQNACTGAEEPPILKMDRSGRLLATWGSGMMDFPHGFDVDDEGNVWAADQRGHVVYKWDSEGELLLTIGRRGTPGDPPLLAEPTGVAVAENGDIFITEGHSFAQGANRVTKYAGDGSFLMSWGETGSGIGEFNVPHDVAIDSAGRVFIGDRANNRIQIFDQAGGFVDVWYQFGRPSGIAIGPDDPDLRCGLRVLRDGQSGVGEGDQGRRRARRLAPLPDRGPRGHGDRAQRRRGGRGGLGGERVRRRRAAAHAREARAQLLSFDTGGHA